MALETVFGGLLKATIFSAIILFTFLSVPAFSTTDLEDPIEALQKKLLDQLEAVKEEIETDCGVVFKRSLADSEQASSYLKCAIERLRSASLNWSEVNQEIIDIAQDQLLQFSLQQIPAGESIPEQRGNLIGAVGYAHKRLISWHQSLGKLIEQLFQAQFFTKHTAQSLLDSLNRSMSETTEAARGYVQILQNKPSLSEERLRELAGELNDEMFKRNEALISAFQQSLLVEKDRIMRQYPDSLERDREAYREVVKHYDDLLEKTFEALSLNARTIWLELPSPDDATQ